MSEQMTIEHVELAFKENAEVKGHLAYLDDKRLVFIGERETNKGEWFLAFRNAEGDDTRLRLSHEAMAMLVNLYNKPRKGDDVFPLQIKTAWQVVVKDKDKGLPLTPPSPPPTP